MPTSGIRHSNPLTIDAPITYENKMPPRALRHAYYRVDKPLRARMYEKQNAHLGIKTDLAPAAICF